MENSASPFARKKNQQLTGRKFNTPQKDLWSVVREGSLNEVDSALALLKKNGGNIDARNVFGLTPLHIATWRNHVPIVRRLLAAGADPDARDGESGWSSLHRALHFGHLAVASILLHSGASLTLEDSKSRTPADLLSGPVLQVVGEEHDSVARDVFSWGSGANYQLGTGNAHIQKLPCRLDVLQGSHIKMLSASKFHSVAVGTRGEVYTWGFGRGGRLGHPDFDIHSGQAAVITPRQVTGLESRQVKAIAAAKHHTVATTEGGEVFTWGSNREGQLGYTSVDTQPTPRRVSSLKSRIVAVAAANKHTAVVSESGEVFTWGCNKEGQLGYGTSNSASNYTPRVVECLKGKVLTGVAAAKYHTVVLGADGEVFTWGHRLVTPRRIVISRNIKKSEGTQLKFHRMERLHVVAIAAGMVHSLALTDDGSLFYWVSSDPDLRCRQLYSMCGRNLVSVSAGKYWTAAVSTTGDIYMWDGKKCKGEPPVPTRLHGVKHATSVSVGETHLLMVCALYHPIYPPKLAENPPKSRLEKEDELDELDEDFMFDKVEDTNVNNETDANKSIPSLKSLCEKAAAEHLVEPKNAIQLLEVADSLEADDLRKHCEDICIRNLDYIVIVSAQAIASASPEILANLEKLWDAKSSEPWSYRRLPTSTATFPAVINSEEDDSDSSEHLRVHSHIKPASKIYEGKRSGSFLHPSDGADESIARQIRAIRKKLQQIEMLEAKQSEGHLLDDQQLAKLKTKSAFESSLTELGIPVHKEDKLPVSLEGKGNKKLEAPKKQKKKSKKNAAQGAVSPAISNAECFPVKGFLASDNSQVSKEKEQDIEFEEIGGKQISDGVPFHHPNKGLPQICKKDVPKIGNIKTASPAASKKKKKGGLSMFLSGALDDVPKDVAPPPPTPKIEGPAWGGAKISEKSTSLLVIQDEQSKTREKQPSGKLRTQVDDEGKNAGHLRLSSFMPVGGASNPIAVVSARTSLASEGEKGTLPWVAAGTSPVFSRPSLRDIQMQEEKKHQSFSHSPKTETAGFSVMTGQGSPSDSNVSSKWFKPDIQSPSSIRSIQIEEKAMKDLKRFYSSVKLVRNQT